MSDGASNHNRYQEEFGAPKPRTAAKVRDHMLPWVQEFIASSPFAVLATADAEGHCDASPKGGQPGFVHVIDERQLLLPDVAGNKLFQSYANIDESPGVGLIFFVPGVDETVRVNGRARRVSADELERHRIALAVHDPDAHARHLQGLLIEVEEAYGHCPRALVFSRLWDTETIGKHRAARPVAKKPRGV